MLIRIKVKIQTYALKNFRIWYFYQRLCNIFILPKLDKRGVRIKVGWKIFQRLISKRGGGDYSVLESIDLLAILKRIRIERFLLRFVEFSNVHNEDRSSNATRSHIRV